MDGYTLVLVYLGMKKLILLLFLLPTIAFGQLTYVPDDVLEEELEGSNFDNDNYVLTSILEGQGSLVLDGNNGQISDYTGVEDAINLALLQINNMTVPTLQLVGSTINGQLRFQDNLSTNIILDNCSYSTLWVYTNPLLIKIDFQNSNNIISGSNMVLINNNNSLQSLDFTNVNLLTGSGLQVGLNASLTQLNLKNGQCILWTSVSIHNNPDLYCIQVDDPSYSEGGWQWVEKLTEPNTHSYSTDCGYPVLAIPEPPTKPKDLLYITDVLGRTTHPTPNALLFYLYDDGSVEKRIQLER